jgi:phospholipid/cholesterol/gamma-HCH transport system substrate-binding protein
MERLIVETNVNYAAVGAFVITLIAASVLAIIWLSSGLEVHKLKTYKVYMHESVSGLNIDSPVEFNGVNVGSVTSVELDNKDPEVVELLLNIRSTTPITKGTVATLQTRGVTGVTFIALKDKSGDVVPLALDKGEKYPVIKTAPSLFVRLDTALSSLSDNLRDVTISIRSLLNKENQQNIKEILLNVQKVTGSLASNNDRMARILENTEKATLQFGPMMKSTSQAMRMFEMQTLPATYQLISNLDNITRSLVDVASDLKQNPSILIRGVQRQTTGPGETP